MNQSTHPIGSDNAGRATDENGGKIQIMPTHWASLRYMSDVKPLNESDAPCLEEIRRVLEKHGRLERLGVTLLHRHFEVADDEIMVEEINFGDRTLVVRPIKKGTIGPCVETAWQLNAGDAIQTCAKQHCYSTCIEQERAFRDLMCRTENGQASL